MHRRSFALAAASVALLAFIGPAAAEDARLWLSGPVIHDNLAIYFVHGPSAAGPVPLTLQEAMVKGVVKVHETGHVNELAVENLGGEEVFIQSGDIVKGGQQDRAMMVSLLLPPRSGRVPIESFCVEQGRWTARGKEDVKTFSSSDSAVPSKAARLAMRAPSPPAQAVEPDVRAPGDPSARPRIVHARRAPDRQGQVWESVASTQRKLAQTLAAPVAAPASATSLQLSLENEKLKDAQAGYVRALQAAGEQEGDIVGYVFAINGKLNSADIYPSNAMFRKMWGKLLSANVTEAIAERAGAGVAADVPDIAAVQAVLDKARAGVPVARNLTATAALETRDSDAAVYSETRRTAGGWIHRNYVVK